MTSLALPAYLPTPAIIVGDAHLGVATHESERELLQLLRYARTEARSMVIMGDLFDFWFAWKHAMPRQSFRILSAIADLVEAGIPVIWLGGNHDCWHGEDLEKETGARYTLEPWHGAIGHWRTELMHGDGLREREDAPYRRLRTLLRNPTATKLFGWLHPDFATRIASSSTRVSRDTRARDDGKALLHVATKRLSEPNGPDLVMHGHTHIPRLERAGYGVYANAGAWYIDQQYVRVDEDTITLLAWKSSGESDVLNTIDRVAEEPAA